MRCHKCFFTIAKFNHLKDYYAILNISQKIDIKSLIILLLRNFFEILIKQKKKSLRKLMKRMKFKF
ncbi:unnamed protein product [Paramecium pentaurelia]|uniref:Uncharacterized protein n=1 Tax=Paramecium pentaurelia TaxID=43138 RepID=A0A8S1TGW9_9CILI|nr:unnamed protein product [Paramecium pentaurelia]